MNYLAKIRDYIVVFAVVGSWSSVFVMLLFSDLFVNPNRVLLFIATSILVAILTSSILLLLLFKFEITKHPRTSLMIVSVPAFLVAAFVMYYNQSRVTHCYNVKAPILEKGIKKSKRKNFNQGGFCKIPTKFDTFDLQVPKRVFECVKVGDTLDVNIEVGRFDFIKITL